MALMPNWAKLRLEDTTIYEGARPSTSIEPSGKTSLDKHRDEEGRPDKISKIE